MEENTEQHKEEGVDYDCQLRRDLRARQREALQDIKGNTLALKLESKENNNHHDINTEVLQAARTMNNTLFRRVRHARELKLDVDILEARAEMSVDQLQNIRKPSRYDAVQLVQVLKKKLTVQDEEKGTSYFDWGQLGKEACVCFKGHPARVSFLAGPLSNRTSTAKKPRKKKRQAKRHRKNKNDEVLVEEVLEEMKQDGQGNHKEEGRPATKLSAAETHMKVLKKHLKTKCAKAGHDGPNDDSDRKSNEIDMIRFIFNPKSFTQTVENILNFSHLVKKGIAGVRKGDDGIVYIRHTDRATEEGEAGADAGNKKGAAALQGVLSLTMRDWRALVKAYQMEEGGLPDRNYNQETPLSFGGDRSDDDDDEEEEEIGNDNKEDLDQPTAASRNFNDDTEMEVEDSTQSKVVGSEEVVAQEESSLPTERSDDDEEHDVILWRTSERSSPGDNGTAPAVVSQSVII